MNDLEQALRTMFLVETGNFRNKKAETYASLALFGHLEPMVQESIQATEVKTVEESKIPALLAMSEEKMPEENRFSVLEQEIRNSLSPQLNILAVETEIRVSSEQMNKLLQSIDTVVNLQITLHGMSFGTNPLLFRKTVHQLTKVTREMQDLSRELNPSNLETNVKSTQSNQS